MTEYSIGLMKFLDEIVLLKKARPEWQKGLLNLPGGHVEGGESARQCMAREWAEETGVVTQPEEWTQRLEILGHDYMLHVFTTFPKDRCELRFAAEEPARWYGLSWLDYDKCVSSLRWIIPLLLDNDTTTLQIKVG